MKTQDLIPLLVADLAPIDRHALIRRFGTALTIGTLVSGLALVSGWGVRSDLLQLIGTSVFWEKVLFPAFIAAAAIWVASRLAIPGMSARGAWHTLLIAYLAFWIIAIGVIATTPAELRLAKVLGQTWRSCPIYIALLSVPIYIALSWAMRGFAPTHTREGGMAIGLLSGAVATLVYVLRCPEMSIAFWAPWYSVGMAAAAAAGGLSAPLALRWA